MCRPPPFSRYTINTPADLEPEPADTDGSFPIVVVAIPTIRDEDDIHLDNVLEVIQSFPGLIWGEDESQTPPVSLDSDRDNWDAFYHALNVIDTTPLAVDFDNLEFSRDDEESFWELLHHQVPATADRGGHVLINLTGFRYEIVGRLRRILATRARSFNDGNGSNEGSGSFSSD